MRLLFCLLILCVSFGCSNRDYSIAECITLETLTDEYGQLIESLYSRSHSISPDGYPEIDVIDHQRRILTSERKTRGIQTGHIQQPSHLPEFGDEYVYAFDRETVYEYKRVLRNATGGFFKGHGPGERLYRTGILRGYREFDGVEHQFLMFKTFRQISEDMYEGVELILSYPRLLERLHCDA